MCVHDYLVELESMELDDCEQVIFADVVYKHVAAMTDKEACKKARERFCVVTVNPYGAKMVVQLRAVYRRGVLFDV